MSLPIFFEPIEIQFQFREKLISIIPLIGEFREGEREKETGKSKSTLRETQSQHLLISCVLSSIGFA